ncbi:hypothetical protein KC909_06215, partial [Candidatus Dojkabacteria bacterium]|nr:hypothetical protein [Candidatus Dojkabacteria bacterium]
KSTSWLYDLEIMNRFLPQEFLDSREIVELKDELQYLGCWGQFLKRDGNIREDDAQVFIEKIQKAETFDQLVECFPHNIFKCQVEIEIFKEFLDI